MVSPNIMLALRDDEIIMTDNNTEHSTCSRNQTAVNSESTPSNKAKCYSPVEESNEEGAIKMIELKNVPPGPEIVSIEATSFTTVHIRWLPPPDWHGLIIGYNIYCKKIEEHDSCLDEQDDKIDTEDGDVVEGAIVGLLPDTRYSIQVTGYSKEGEGQRNKPETVTTKPLKPFFVGKSPDEEWSGLSDIWKKVENDVTSRSEATKMKNHCKSCEEQLISTNDLTVITSQDTISPEVEVGIDICNSNKGQFISMDALTVTSQNAGSLEVEGSMDICKTNEKQFKSTDALTGNKNQNTMSPEVEGFIDICNIHERQFKNTNTSTATGQNIESPEVENSIDICNSNEKQFKLTDALTVTGQNTESPEVENSIDICNSNEKQFKLTDALTVTGKNTESPEVENSIDICNSNEKQFKLTDASTVTSQDTVSLEVEDSIDICNSNEKQFKRTDASTVTSQDTVSPEVEDSIDNCNINEKQFNFKDVLTVTSQDTVSSEAQHSIDNGNTNEKQFKSTNALTEHMNQNTMSPDRGVCIDICISPVDKNTSESARNCEYSNAGPDSCMANNITVDPFNETVVSHGTLNTGVKRIDMDNGYERNRYKKTWTKSSQGSTRPFILFSGFHLPRLLREHKGKTKHTNVRVSGRRKRKHVTNEEKDIPSELMKLHLSDTSDIVTKLELAPPTKKLMHWKETQGVEKLFTLEGRPRVSKVVEKMFKRNLKTKADTGGDNRSYRNSREEDRSAIGLYHFTRKIAKMWKNLPLEEKKIWQKRAQKNAAEQTVIHKEHSSTVEEPSPLVTSPCVTHLMSSRTCQGSENLTIKLHGKELHKGLLGYFSNEEVPFEDSFHNVKNIHCSESECLAEDDESEYYVKNAACFMLFSKINMPLAMKKIQERGRCGSKTAIRTVARMWKQLSKEDKQLWKRRAEAAAKNRAELRNQTEQPPTKVFHKPITRSVSARCAIHTKEKYKNQRDRLNARKQKTNNGLIRKSQQPSVDRHMLRVTRSTSKLTSADTSETSTTEAEDSAKQSGDLHPAWIDQPQVKIEFLEDPLDTCWKERFLGHHYRPQSNGNCNVSMEETMNGNVENVTTNENILPEALSINGFDRCAHETVSRNDRMETNDIFDNRMLNDEAASFKKSEENYEMDTCIDKSGCVKHISHELHSSDLMPLPESIVKTEMTDDVDGTVLVYDRYLDSYVKHQKGYDCVTNTLSIGIRRDCDVQPCAAAVGIENERVDESDFTKLYRKLDTVNRYLPDEGRNGPITQYLEQVNQDDLLQSPHKAEPIEFEVYINKSDDSETDSATEDDLSDNLAWEAMPSCYSHYEIVSPENNNTKSIPYDEDVTVMQDLDTIDDGSTETLQQITRLKGDKNDISPDSPFVVCRHSDWKVEVNDDYCSEEDIVKNHCYTDESITSSVCDIHLAASSKGDLDESITSSVCGTQLGMLNCVPQALNVVKEPDKIPVHTFDGRTVENHMCNINSNEDMFKMEMALDSEICKRESFGCDENDNNLTEAVVMKPGIRHHKPMYAWMVKNGVCTDCSVCTAALKKSVKRKRRSSGAKTQHARTETSISETNASQRPKLLYGGIRQQRPKNVILEKYVVDAAKTYTLPAAEELNQKNPEDTLSDRRVIHQNVRHRRPYAWIERKGGLCSNCSVCKGATMKKVKKKRGYTPVESSRARLVENSKGNLVNNKNAGIESLLLGKTLEIRLEKLPVGAIDIDHTYGSRAPSPKLHSQELGEKIKSTREVKAPVLKEFEEKIKSTQENKAPKLQELDEKIKSTRADKAVKKRMKLYCQEKRIQLMKKKQEMTARKKKLQFEVEFLEYLDKVYEKAEESHNNSDASLSKEQ